MLVWLFWGCAAVLGLVGIAVLVAAWELVRRDPDKSGPPLPMRAHSIDLNLGDPTAPVVLNTAGEAASPHTDSDSRRRALAQAIERMSEPSRPSASSAATVRESWEDTRPRVNLPGVERTPPA